MGDKHGETPNARARDQSERRERDRPIRADSVTVTESGHGRTPTQTGLRAALYSEPPASFPNRARPLLTPQCC